MYYTLTNTFAVDIYRPTKVVNNFYYHGYTSGEQTKKEILKELDRLSANYYEIN